MSETRKVFIYNGTGASFDSALDLNELLSTDKIFLGRPDVALTDFNFNMDGLSDPVFVVPGGSTSAIGYILAPIMTKIKMKFGDNFSYVGVCAGAYLGAADAELFYTTHKLDNKRQEFEPACFIWSTKEQNYAFSIIEDYKAYGAFYPDNTYLYSPAKMLMPYKVDISLSENNVELNQLYVSCPLFLPDEKHSSSRTEVAAVYTNASQYRFFSTQNLPLSSKPAAIVRQLPKENADGKLLAATHIETCVENSRLLHFFKESSENNIALPESQFTLLSDEKKTAKPYIESLLRETLKVVRR